MKLQIAFKPIYQEWSIMVNEYSIIVPCLYALVIDGQRTFVSKDIEDVKKVRRRVRHYQGVIA